MNLPRMSLHIGDYKRDTSHLRAEGHGAYLLLIMHYWTTGGLPDDDDQLSAIAGLSGHKWKNLKPVIAKFFLKGWKHKRIDNELEEAHKKYELAVKNGRLGGRPKGKKITGGFPQNNREVSPEKPGGYPGANLELTGSKATLTLKKERIRDIDSAGGGGGVGGGVGVGVVEKVIAKKPMIRDEANRLSDSCLQVLGFDPQFLTEGWNGLPYQMEIILDRGYDPSVVLATFARLAGQKPLKPMSYFVKAVESAQQNQIKPAGVPNGKSGSVVQAADRLVKQLAYFDEPAPSDQSGIRSGASETPLRAIPERGRE